MYFHLNKETDSGSEPGLTGIECTPSPGCVPIECRNPRACSGLRSQFQIIKTDETQTGRKIRNGNTVVLRSIEDYSYFLDCSNPNSCILSECREDNVEDPYNASYVPSCTKHQFEIIGINRAPNKILNTGHKFQFKNKDSHSDPQRRDFYLTCNGKFCHLKPQGQCESNRPPALFVAKGTEKNKCKPDTFTISKI